MTQIEWNPPEPRHGLIGMWDKFAGPGATPSEERLQLVGGVLLSGGLGILLFLERASLTWSAWEVLLVAILVFDVTGGIITNATSAAKRWYHRPGQEGLGAHLPFIAVHGVHLLLVALVFRDGDWAYWGVMYAYLLGAATMILLSPLYLQRPTALAVYSGALLLGLYVFDPTPGLEWFIPFIYLKLLVSHLLKEAPFTAESR